MLRNKGRGRHGEGAGGRGLPRPCLALSWACFCSDAAAAGEHGGLDRLGERQQPAAGRSGEVGLHQRVGTHPGRRCALLVAVGGAATRPDGRRQASPCGLPGRVNRALRRRRRAGGGGRGRLGLVLRPADPVVAARRGGHTRRLAVARRGELSRPGVVATAAPAAAGW